MNFAKPGLLLLILCVPFLIYYYKIILKTASKRREKLFSARNYFALLNFSSQPNTTVKIIMYIIVLTLIAFASSRPQGIEKPDEVQASAIDICFLIDVSESMKAVDIGDTNRLDLTKAVVSHLIDNLKNDRVGIVAFSGDASSICPLTLDHTAAQSLLMQADFDLIEKGGTRLDYAIETARARFSAGEDVAKVIIIFTDGENHEGKTVEAAVKAYREGIVIHCVGIGSKAGARIPIGRDSWGELVYKKHKGRDVITKLDEKVLQEIAANASGEYFHVSDQASLLAMVSSLKNLKKRALRVSNISVREEMFSYFAFAALIILLIEYVIPSTRPVKHIGLLLIAAAAVFSLFQSPCYAVSWLKTPSQITQADDEITRKTETHIMKGANYFKGAEFKKAESEFQSAKILSPRSFVTDYDIGCAMYKNKDYSSAVKAFENSILQDEKKTQFEPYYNKGNSHFMMQDYKNAVASYEEALKIKPDDDDARYNLEIAKKKLEEQMKKEQENKTGNNQQQDKQKEKNTDENSQKQQENKNDPSRQNAQNQQDSQKNGEKGNDENKRNDAQNENKGQPSSQGENKDAQAGKDAVENLVDKQNLEKYKNLKVDPNRVKMFLKDLENDEARVQQLYQRNKKRSNEQDEMDLFNMNPEELHDYMRRQMMGEEQPRPQKKKGKPDDRKDW